MSPNTNRYNIVVRISANIAVQADSPEVARASIESLFRREPIVRVGKAEFIVEDVEVTGIFDKDWKEVETGYTHFGERGAMFKVGDRVRIKQNAFPGSDDPEDAQVRGQVGTIVDDMGEGVWHVEMEPKEFDDSYFLLLESEIELVAP